MKVYSQADGTDLVLPCELEPAQGFWGLYLSSVPSLTARPAADPS